MNEKSSKKAVKKTSKSTKKTLKKTVKKAVVVRISPDEMLSSQLEAMEASLDKCLNKTVRAVGKNGLPVLEPGVRMGVLDSVKKLRGMLDEAMRNQEWKEEKQDAT